jgi:hypothetical protein
MIEMLSSILGVILWTVLFFTFLTRRDF